MAVCACCECKYFLDRKKYLSSGPSDHAYCLFPHLHVFLKELVLSFKEIMISFHLDIHFHLPSVLFFKKLIGNVQPEVNDWFSKQKNIIKSKMSGPNKGNS